MILTKNIENLKSKDKLKIKCDYCTNIFERNKSEVIRGKKIIQKDACSEKTCINKKRKESNYKKYGVENVAQKKEIKDKQVKTLIKNYGVSVPCKSEKIKQKIAKTNIKKYGNICSLHGKDQKIKTKKTWENKYGCEHPFESPVIRNKIKTSMEKKYGKHYTKTELYLEKTRESCLEKYGVEHHSKCEQTKEKRSKTNLKKYGYSYPSQNKKILEKILYSNKNKIKTYGKKEKEIKTYLKSICGLNFESHILKNKELDAFNKELSIAFEYCGLYWHNENSPEPRGRDYHYNKYQICEKENIRLVTIFEDEWIHRNNQCKGYIKSILKIFKNRIYARKCEIKEMTNKQSNLFYENFHIQGKPYNTKKSFGLYYNKEVVGVISLGLHHRQKNKLVINRLCFKEDTQIIGGASKLFKKCKEYAKKNNFDDITTWSDNRWSNGSVYKKLGFTLDKESKPDYSYVKLDKKYCRVSKQSQKKSNSGCPKEVKESDFAKSKNLARIWDCGKKRWIFKIK